MGAFTNTIRRVGATRIIILTSILAVILAFISYFGHMINKSEMTMLYGNLDVKETGEIVAKLQGMGEEFELKGDGTHIFVPFREAPRLRMLLAQDGLPNGGSVGYEIFDKGDSLSTTAFTQDMNYLRALEGELAKSIKTFSAITAARVHLVIPKREAFSRNERSPSASVVLRMGTAGSLSKHQISAIQHLVASAVPGLETSQISIIDNHGKLLAKGGESKDTVSMNNDFDAYRLSLEDHMSSTIETLIEKVVGYGKVRAQVALDLDLDRVTEDSEIFNPEGQVIRSQQVINDNSSSSDAGEGGAVSARNAVPGPGGAEGDSAGSGGSNNNANKTQEIINYEVSKTIRHFVKESGDIKRLTVAVIVDGTYENEEEGTGFKPRSEEDIKKIEEIIRSAVGIKPKRGDELTVKTMEFSKKKVEVAEIIDNGFLGFEKKQLVRFIEFILFLVFGLVLVFGIVKPLLSKFLETFEAERLKAEADEAYRKAQEARRIQEEIEERRLREEEERDAREAERNASRGKRKKQIRNVEGLMAEKTIEDVNSIVENYPQDTAKIISSWMAEG